MVGRGADVAWAERTHNRNVGKVLKSRGTENEVNSQALVTNVVGLLDGAGNGKRVACCCKNADDCVMAVDVAGSDVSGRVTASGDTVLRRLAVDGMIRLVKVR